MLRVISKDDNSNDSGIFQSLSIIINKVETSRLQDRKLRLGAYFSEGGSLYLDVS